MERIDIIFKFEGSYNQNSFSNTTPIVQGLVLNAIKINVETGKAFKAHAAKYFDEKIEEIKELIRKDFSQYPFSKIEIEKFEPEKIYNDKTHVQEAQWTLKFILTSDIFTCINILPDKTIVFFKKDGDTIQFIKLAEGMTMVLQNVLHNKK